jgi:hypothetical protein
MPGVPLTPDELLTTRSVRKRLDLTRPVPLDLVKQCLEIALQAPSGGMRQGALIPTAYYTGDTFRPAARRPLADVLHVDRW